MSRTPSSAQVTLRPLPNVYTGLAFAAMAATLGALVYMIVQFASLGILKDLFNIA
jgi:hypothetical protein